MAAFSSPAQSSDRMAPIQKWNPEMEKARMEGAREWERQKEEKNLLQITVIQMSLGYIGFPVK